MTEKIEKAGNRRKRRLLRLPQAVGSGGDRSFTPSDDNWQRMETAYGHILKAADREEIVALVENYFRFQPAERAAPFADDTLAYLDRLDKAGKKFWNTLLERQNMPMSMKDGQSYIAEEDQIRDAGKGYAQSVLGSHLKRIDFRHQTGWSDLLDIVGAFQAAVIAARDDIDDRSKKVGFVEGRQWDNLVLLLGKWATERGLPVGLTKYDDPARAAPFVALVHELQASFPPEFRRHEASYAAINQAISVARRKLKGPSTRKDKSEGTAT